MYQEFKWKQDTFIEFFSLNAACLINLDSHRSGDWLLLRLLGVAKLSFRTLDTLAGVTQSRALAVRTIGARNGVWILQGKSYLK